MKKGTLVWLQVLALLAEVERKVTAIEQVLAHRGRSEEVRKAANG